MCTCVAPFLFFAKIFYCILLPTLRISRLINFSLDDYHKFFGISFESMFGNDWIELIRGLLNSMDNIFTRILPGGYLLFFMKLAKLNERLLTIRKNRNMEAFLDKIKIDPKNIKAYHDDQAHSSLSRYTFVSISILFLNLDSF